MPEYLAPGVYVEETSFRSKSIEGVSTTTTGFVGPSRYGPVDLPPDVLTSLADFERVYGDRQKLLFGSATRHNYLWHSVRAFFEEGGKRLYIVRVFKPKSGTFPAAVDLDKVDVVTDGSAYNDGVARGLLGTGDKSLKVRARFPGAAGNVRVQFTVRLGQNVLSGAKDKAALGPVSRGDLLWISDGKDEAASAFKDNHLLLADFDTVGKTWRLRAPKADGTDDWWLNTPAGAAGGNAPKVLDPAQAHDARRVTLTVSVVYADGSSLVWDGLAVDPNHQNNGVPDSAAAKFARLTASSAEETTLPVVFIPGNALASGRDWIDVLATVTTSLKTAMGNFKSSDAERSAALDLTGGNDGSAPTAAEYEGLADDNSSTKTGLKAFEDIDDISIVAAPGSTFNYENNKADANTVINLLIGHAQRMRYRIAVLDSGNAQTVGQVRAMRGQFDSTYAALYYPWVRILDPVTNTEIVLPPSGFVAGIYARNDINRGVFKAPANEVVTLALGFELLLNKGQQEVLNPEGVNCFRFFEGRGYRLWGARTITSDQEWKYVNLRRYFAYLEHSIDKGTQFAVFEPNGDLLWANVRRTIGDFLLNEWQSGALLGDKPEKAYFVRCDRSTMTQNDLDNGRLICLIGVAPLRPAEFVIFRIGQWTADAKS